jgi:hypothetical protein
MMMIEQGTSFVLCVENEGFEVSLEKRKVYLRLADEPNGDDGLIRVIDESGEDYLYPTELFVPIILPKAATAVFEEASV